MKLRMLKLSNPEEKYDNASIIQLIKYCGRKKDVMTMRRILAEKPETTDDTFIANTLIRSYTKCCAMKEAQHVFDGLTDPDIVSWNAIIAGYAEQGFGEQALTCLKKMKNEKIMPDSVTYACILKACAIIRSLEIVKEIHTHVRGQGLLDKNIIVGNSLVNAYGKCGVMKEAQKVFDQLTEQNVVSWNAVIAGYAEHGFGEEALICYRQMENARVIPNSVTYISILKACAIVRDLCTVKEIHDHVIEGVLLNKHIVLGTALMNAYAKCGALKEARDIFDQSTERNVVSWNVLIGGYAEQGFGEEALMCFREMETNGVTPDSLTYTCSLKACHTVKALEIVEEIHAHLREQGLLKKHVDLGNSLVNAYAKCGAMKKAREVFDELTEQSVVSCSALIGGYADHGFGEAALTCFQEMENALVIPNSVAYACILKACSIVGAFEVVKDIHSQVREEGLLNKDIVFANSLINAYSKCGAVKEAQEIFDQMTDHNLVSWNAILAGYAQSGLVDEMMFLFNKMIAEGIFPDAFTFLALLTGCSHGALLKEAEMLFYMIKTHGLALIPELYTSMVDLFGRAGWFDKAKCFVVDHTPTLLSFLGACQKGVNVNLGRWAFERLIQLDENCPSAYVSMANIYATAGMMKEADEIELLRVKREAMKTQGTNSLTDVLGFVATGKGHSVDSKLEELCFEIMHEGHLLGFHWVSRTIPDHEKEKILHSRAVKNAIGCTLINTHEC